MSLLRFGRDRQLSVVVNPPTSFYKGAGLHRLTFPLALDARGTMSGAVPIMVTGEAWLSNNGHDWLGTVATVRHVVSSAARAFDAELRLAITDEQLAIIEHRRAGSDLEIQVDLWVTLGFDPAATDGGENDRWPSTTVQEQVQVHRGVWAQLLEQSNAGTSLAIVLPVPLSRSSKATTIGEHLRSAIRKVNAGEYTDAVVAARRALDVLDDAWPRATAVLAINQRERTVDQRLGLLREAIASLAGPAPHGDAVAASISWDRERALAVIASVAALAACLR